jgi:DNA-binding transcriptional LysR family regulator
VLKEAIELETLAKNMGQGWGGEVRLVVDHNFPTELLMQALSKFDAIGQGAAHVRLREVAALQAEEVLRDVNVDLAISERVPLGFLGEPLAEIEYLPVVHPGHPLMQVERELTATDLAQHVQIGIGQHNDAEKACEHHRQQRRWTMNSFETVVAAVREGLGYAWLPRHRIGAWLEQGALVQLPLADKRSHKTMLYLIHGRPWTATPAAGKFADVLRGLTAVDLPDQGPAH